MSNITTLLSLTENELELIAFNSVSRMFEIRRKNDNQLIDEFNTLSKISHKAFKVLKNLRHTNIERKANGEK